MMRLQNGLLIFLPLILRIAPSQVITDIPQCWQTCAEDTGDLNCNALDIPCLCRASSKTSSNFLTSVVSCIKRDCDNSLDLNVLLGSLQIACDLAGEPLPDSAVTSAEQAHSSSTSTYDDGQWHGPSTTSVTPGTVTVTTSAPGSASETSFFAQTTFPTVTTTVSTRATDHNGNTVAVLVPVTIEISTTIFGEPETHALSNTKSSSLSAKSSLPGTITSTSLLTTTATSNGAAVTSTIESVISGARSSISAASGSVSSAIASASASASSSDSDEESNSGGGSPFDSSGFGVHGASKKSLLGAAVMIAAGVIWF